MINENNVKIIHIQLHILFKTFTQNILSYKFMRQFSKIKTITIWRVKEWNNVHYYIKDNLLWKKNQSDDNKAEKSIDMEAGAGKITKQLISQWHFMNNKMLFMV